MGSVADPRFGLRRTPLCEQANDPICLCGSAPVCRLALAVCVYPRPGSVGSKGRVSQDPLRDNGRQPKIPGCAACAYVLRLLSAVTGKRFSSHGSRAVDRQIGQGHTE